MSLTATMTAGGALFAFKGHQDGLRAVQATADTAVPRLTFAPFAGSVEGRFASGQVAVTARDGTERHRDNPRAAFTDLAPDTTWDDLHLLYFSGYAIWNYLCAPLFLIWPASPARRSRPGPNRPMRAGKYGGGSASRSRRTFRPTAPNRPSTSTTPA
jgi:hypothetical protein